MNADVWEVLERECLGIDVYIALCDKYDIEPNNAETVYKATDAFIGEFDSWEDYCIQKLRDVFNVPDTVLYYMDMDHYVRDFLCGMDEFIYVFMPDGRLMLFSNF